MNIYFFRIRQILIWKNVPCQNSIFIFFFRIRFWFVPFSDRTECNRNKNFIIFMYQKDHGSRANNRTVEIFSSKNQVENEEREKKKCKNYDDGPREPVSTLQHSTHYATCTLLSVLRAHAHNPHSFAASAGSRRTADTFRDSFDVAMA